MMRASFMPAAGEVAIGDFPIPGITGPGQVLVRLEFSSICGSDVHSVFDGFAVPSAMSRPGYPGHEGVGIVVASSAEAFVPGQRVLTVPLGPDGACFAEYMVISEDFVVPVPEGLDPGRALLAQQYGTVLFAMRLFWPDFAGIPEGRKAEVCAIIGAGSAGLFFLQLARRIGFEKVIVSDLHPGRRALAERFGADRVVDGRTESFVDVVAEETGGAGADLVVEAAGYDACRADAVGAVRVGGVIGLFGFPEVHGLAPFPQFDAFRKVARIQWANGAQREPGLIAFRDALADIEQGRVQVDHCRQSSYSLEQLPEAMRVAREHGHGTAKIQIELGGGAATP